MDTSKLKPANQNPWYILMTLHGEQEGDEIDEVLAEKNRKLWNAWVCQGMEEQERYAIADKIGIDRSETDWTDEIAHQVANLFAARWVEYHAPNSRADIPEHDKICDLRKVVFVNPIHLERAILPKVSFGTATFTQFASFNSSVFEQTASFGGATFEGDTRFIETKFVHRVDFSGTTFNRTSSFRGATFDKEARFTHARFKQGVYFRNAAFEHSANFFHSFFEQGATFGHVSFEHDAFFVDAIFGQSAVFRCASFRQDANFSGTTFSETGDFRDSDFGGLVDFGGLRSEPDNNADPANFGIETIFSGAHFHKRADFFYRRFGPYDKPTETLTFANAIFDAPVSFEEAVFPHLMPVLTNTTLPESTKLTANRQNWPTLKPGVLARLDARLGLRKPVAYSEQPPEIVKASAASLRHAMARQMLPEEEHFFFRREMWGAQRSGPLLARPIIWLYGAVSNYGHSISRPAALLSVLWLAGLIFFAGKVTIDDAGVQTTLGTWEAAFFSFANMFKFFGLLGTYFEDVAGSFPEPIQVAAGTQTVLAFILLFFLGLGLRTRFRLR